MIPFYLPFKYHKFRIILLNNIFYTQHITDVMTTLSREPRFCYISAVTQRLYCSLATPESTYKPDHKGDQVIKDLKAQLNVHHSMNSVALLNEKNLKAPKVLVLMASIEDHLIPTRIHDHKI